MKLQKAERDHETHYNCHKQGVKVVLHLRCRILRPKTFQTMKNRPRRAQVYRSDGVTSEQPSRSSAFLLQTVKNLKL
jgi:G3E family GTPase